MVVAVKTESSMNSGTSSGVYEGHVVVDVYPSTSLGAVLSLRRCLDSGTIRVGSFTPIPARRVRFEVEALVPVRFAQFLRSLPDVVRVEEAPEGQPQDLLVLVNDSS